LCVYIYLFEWLTTLDRYKTSLINLSSALCKLSSLSIILISSVSEVMMFGYPESLLSIFSSRVSGTSIRECIFCISYFKVTSSYGFFKR